MDGRCRGKYCEGAAPVPADIPPRKKLAGTVAASRKPRKQPLKVKPPTWTDEEWEAEKARCAVITVDRKRRRQIKEAAEVLRLQLQ